MDDSWEVRPRTGIGRLQFGMTRAEVASLAGQLGPITYENDLGAGMGDIAALLQPFGAWISDEDVAATKAAMAEVAHVQQGMVQEHRGCGLMLTFQDDALAEIMAPCDGPPIHLGGVALFEAPRIEAVAALSRALGDQPFTDGENVAYRNAPLWLHGFMLGAPGFDPHPDRQSAREVNILLRAAAMRGTAAVEWDRFHALALPA
ncbi:hypothetical protein BKE38_02915 [Pseudoroseomonas deserti]|uniref:Uncharacterized protein n=1 Tax=Teichococcus deserti TaxID=1817963 RepID=A0A1V2H7X6_9PROT|nr:hypothetical protein [Pseudoroseomonas deserti]ONG58297.1 hypothetical protein BKE38_02915 [Pseudoroseomonas deserti]